jgi:hypothetical protein
MLPSRSGGSTPDSCAPIRGHLRSGGRSRVLSLPLAAAELARGAGRAELDDVILDREVGPPPGRVALGDPAALDAYQPFGVWLISCRSAFVQARHSLNLGRRQRHGPGKRCRVSPLRRHGPNMAKPLRPAGAVRLRDPARAAEERNRDRPCDALAGGGRAAAVPSAPERCRASAGEAEGRCVNQLRVGDIGRRASWLAFASSPARRSTSLLGAVGCMRRD